MQTRLAHKLQEIPNFRPTCKPSPLTTYKKFPTLGPHINPLRSQTTRNSQLYAHMQTRSAQKLQEIPYFRPTCKPVLLTTYEKFPTLGPHANPFRSQPTRKSQVHRSPFHTQCAIHSHVCDFAKSQGRNQLVAR